MNSFVLTKLGEAVKHLSRLVKKPQSAYAKTKTQISFAVTAKLISSFVFATQIVHFLFFLNPKFQASNLLLRLYSLICVGPVRKPHCWFSHEMAHLTHITTLTPGGKGQHKTSHFFLEHTQRARWLALSQQGGFRDHST